MTNTEAMQTLEIMRVSLERDMRFDELDAVEHVLMFMKRTLFPTTTSTDTKAQLTDVAGWIASQYGDL